MDPDWPLLAGSWRQIPRVLTVRVVTRSHDHKVSDFTLPGKTSKESTRCPYHKPTQVDEVNIHRRSRERLLRN
jgi:hypothetical protein